MERPPEGVTRNPVDPVVAQVKMLINKKYRGINRVKTRLKIKSMCSKTVSSWVKQQLMLKKKILKLLMSAFLFFLIFK